MNYMRLGTTVLMFMLLISLVSCKSRQDKPGSSTTATQSAQTASPQEMADARSAAIHVLTQFEAGEFSQIYKESSPDFKDFGNEADFVAQYQQTRQKSGALNNPKETNFETRAGNTYVLTYRMVNDHFITDIHLTFARSSNGKMELAGLYEHDEPKK
jgi:hypothetical protein